MPGRSAKLAGVWSEQSCWNVEKPARRNRFLIHLSKSPARSISDSDPSSACSPPCEVISNLARNGGRPTAVRVGMMHRASFVGRSCSFSRGHRVKLFCSQSISAELDLRPRVAIVRRAGELIAR